MRRRDLSAFEQPVRRTSTPAPPVRRSMSRITLSLPTPLADALRTAAIRRGVGYRALIIDAVEGHGAEITDSAVHPPGRTQVPLNLPGEDLMAIDRGAHNAGVNRSAFVTECLSRYLDLRPTT